MFNIEKGPNFIKAILCFILTTLVAYCELGVGSVILFREIAERIGSMSPHPLRRAVPLSSGVKQRR